MCDLLIRYVYAVQIFCNYVSLLGMEAIGCNILSLILLCMVTMESLAAYLWFVEMPGPTLEELAFPCRAQRKSARPVILIQRRTCTFRR